MKEAGLTEIPLSHIRERIAYAGQEISTGRLRAVHVACNAAVAARQIPPRCILLLILVPRVGTGSS